MGIKPITKSCQALGDGLYRVGRPVTGTGRRERLPIQPIKTIEPYDTHKKTARCAVVRQVTWATKPNWQCRPAPSLLAVSVAVVKGANKIYCNGEKFALALFV